LNFLFQSGDIEAYPRGFMDARGWNPYVRSVCLRHRLLPCQVVRAGLPGTYPTFVVDERWVVKFFGQLFGGELAFAAEREAARLLATHGSFPAPRVVAQGHLLPGESDWTWPYLVYEFVPGISLGEVYGLVTFADKLDLARDLGKLTHRLHALSLDNSPLFRPIWEPFLDFLRSQTARCLENHRRWGILPERLVGQIDMFLLPPEELVDTRLPPHWIHADLTRDHLLGRLEGGRWRTSGLIDFGDALVGNLYYELVTLHLDLFAGDTRLLDAFLLAYGTGAADRPDFSRRAMSTALLHPFNVLECVHLIRPSLFQVETLQEMADLLWKG
jgi:hygromycin-B 7''-O-kinase